MPWPKGKPKPFHDLAGKRFDRLVALEPTDERKWRCVVWRCVCDCGNETRIPSKNLLSGNSGSCGCRTKEMQRASVRLPEGEAAFRRLYRRYEREAKKKGREFSIDPELFRKLTSGLCFYCGSGVTNVVDEWQFNGVYEYNGLDRVDTNQGYTLHNVVSCCKHCNVAKRAMTQDEFASWVDKIYTHWARKYWDLD